MLKYLRFPRLGKKNEVVRLRVAGCGLKITYTHILVGNMEIPTFQHSNYPAASGRTLFFNPQPAPRTPHPFTQNIFLYLTNIYKL